MTITEARELVGRTYERDGKRRTVVEIDTTFAMFDVLWKRPGSGTIRRAWVSTFDEWISKATEVADETVL